MILILQKMISCIVLTLDMLLYLLNRFWSSSFLLSLAASLAVVGELQPLEESPLELDVLASKAWPLSFKMKEWMSVHKLAFLGMLIFS